MSCELEQKMAQINTSVDLFQIFGEVISVYNAELASIFKQLFANWDYKLQSQYSIKEAGHVTHIGEKRNS
jgi:hypothetical protein